LARGATRERQARRYAHCSTGNGDVANVVMMCITSTLIAIHHGDDHGTAVPVIIHRSETKHKLLVIKIFSNWNKNRSGGKGKTH
jgi:hypothetical protein